MARELMYDPDGVAELKHAIVRQAVRDYIAAYDEGDWDAVDELEAWFVCEYGQLLCEGRGELVVERCRKLAQKEEDNMAVYVVKLECADGHEQIIKERLERFLGRYGRVSVTIKDDERKD